MAISDWPASERPREKLLAQGAAHLSDAELLAIFLRVGVVGKSAVDLARELLTRFGGLNALFGAAREEFNAVPGMGDAKYSQLQAVLEMARRALLENLKRDALEITSNSVRQYLRLTLGTQKVEAVWGLFIDAQMRLIRATELARGTLDQTSVYPREIVKAALAHNAHALILAHNHPSGRVAPSDADKQLTRNLKNALATIDVRLLDHFIVAGSEVYSFSEHGLL
jgi:DNA repair protein RadC